MNELKKILEQIYTEYLLEILYNLMVESELDNAS